jgi:hypothetical protein
MPQPMEVESPTGGRFAGNYRLDGGELSGINKPLKATTREHKPTNIQTLTSQLEKITVKEIVKEQKKKRKPKYIDTTSLLRFTRAHPKNREDIS